MNENIYAPPTAAPQVIEPQADTELASRGSRFGASLIDSLTIMVFTLPTMYFTGGFEGMAEGQTQSAIYNIAMGFVGFLAFALINLKLLKTKGQTIGKTVLGIKIVDMNGQLPTLKGHYLKRYITFFIPGQFPVVGPIFSLANALAIFGKQRRCIHDLVAGTQVVNCGE